MLLKIYRFFNNILYCIVYFFRWCKHESSKIEVESFIVSDNDIKILFVSDGINELIIDNNNLIRYLRHHILHNSDKFENVYFDKPVFVRFKYLNETYQICLSKLESTKDCHLDIVSSPKYLSAVINDDVYITDQIKELHGPTKNFFNHIPDAISDFSVLLAEHTGKLETFNMLGNKEVHILKSS
jgi:hypothetical protein